MASKRTGVVTPSMIAGLVRLERGELVGTGRITRQQLAREGLATYDATFSLEPGWSEWDREMQITAQGRAVAARVIKLGGPNKVTRVFLPPHPNARTPLTSVRLRRRRRARSSKLEARGSL